MPVNDTIESLAQNSRNEKKKNPTEPVWKKEVFYSTIEKNR